jgi:hypothetical protein
MEGIKLRRTQKCISKTDAEYGDIQVDVWEDMETGQVSIRVRKYDMYAEPYPLKRGMILELPDPVRWNPTPEGASYLRIKVDC